MGRQVQAAGGGGAGHVHVVGGPVCRICETEQMRRVSHGPGAEGRKGSIYRRLACGNTFMKSTQARCALAEKGVHTTEKK